MVRVGLIGWRGLVGSELMSRMRAEHDFDHFDPVFASTSQVGQNGPAVNGRSSPLIDALDVNRLKELDIIITCQGSSYSTKMHPALREAGWTGYWIDAASALRMAESSVLVLDPVNRHVIDDAIRTGVKDYIGGNCSVSLMLMAVSGLFKAGLVEWISAMTYQAASGGGAKPMRELASQMAVISSGVRDVLGNPDSPISELDAAILKNLENPSFPTTQFGAPLAGSALPWIDSEMPSGQSREEWKGELETHKILGTDTPIPVDGLCVRIASNRSHAQALTIKLAEDLPIAEVERIIAGGNDFVEVVENKKDVTLRRLTPVAVARTLSVRIGRIRKLTMGPKYLAAFTVGDHLLWGAAEPLRRFLRLLIATR